MKKLIDKQINKQRGERRNIEKEIVRVKKTKDTKAERKKKGRKKSDENKRKKKERKSAKPKKKERKKLKKKERKKQRNKEILIMIERRSRISMKINLFLSREA